jgi:hypothetical protein
VRVVPMAFVKGTEPAACGARRQSVPPMGPPGARPPGGPTPPGTPGGPQAGAGALLQAPTLPRDAMPMASPPSTEAPSRPAPQSLQGP